MNKLYMGIDSGAIYTKGVIIDSYDNILASDNIETNGEVVESVKIVINNMLMNIDLDSNTIVAIGITGVAKRLVGTLLDADVIINQDNFGIILRNFTAAICRHPVYNNDVISP